MKKKRTTRRYTLWRNPMMNTPLTGAILGLN